jgi:hypothetical protein
MSAFWLNFADGKQGCVEADTAGEATKIGLELRGSAVIQIRTLPYPADPRINPVDHPTYGVCPSFCYTPTRCAGSPSCPKPYSCVE